MLDVKRRMSMSAVGEKRRNITYAQAVKMVNQRTGKWKAKYQTAGITKQWEGVDRFKEVSHLHSRSHKHYDGNKIKEKKEYK